MVSKKEIEIFFESNSSGVQTIMCDDLNAMEYVITVTSESNTTERLIIWIAGASKHVTVNVEMNIVQTKIAIDINIRAENAQKHLLRLYQYHTAANTQSNCVIKGIAYDTSTIDYEGLITLEPHSYNAQADQKSKFLIMSENATVRSVPSLQAHHNQVQCGHATTISYIDPIILWYASQRGIKAETIEQLIEENFFH